MLKIRESTGSAANPKENKSKAGIKSIFGNNEVGGGEVINQISTIKRINQAKTTKSKILVNFKNCDFPPNFRNMEVRLGFLTPKARLAFTQLE